MIINHYNHITLLPLTNGMSHLNSIIQFTLIGIQHGLPLDIIKLILSFDNPIEMVACDFCKDFFSTIYYQRMCVECKNNSVLFPPRRLLLFKLNNEGCF